MGKECNQGKIIIATQVKNTYETILLSQPFQKDYNHEDRKYDVQNPTIFGMP